MYSSQNNIAILIALMLFTLCYTAFSQEINKSIVIDELDEDTLATVQDTQSLILKPQPTQKQWTFGNKKLVFNTSPCHKYKKGKRISKVGLVTGIVGSGILTATVIYAGNHRDPYAEIAIPGLVGITSSIVSINLTTIGLIIKGCNKKKCLDKN